MKFNIRGERGRNLCLSCVEAHITTDVRGDREIFCRAVRYAQHIRVPVVVCSGYQEIGKMQKHEAAQLGWVLEVKKGKIVGFRPPTQKDKDDW